MSTMSEEEKKRIRETPMQELLASGEWVKLYEAVNPSLKLYDSDYPDDIKPEDIKPRCRHLDGEWFEGEEIQVFCAHQDTSKTHSCPFGDEVECELKAHQRNLEKIGGMKMTKMRIKLNWGLQPDNKLKWGFLLSPSPSSKTIDFPTDFYKNAFQEVIENGGKAHLIIIDIDDKQYTLTFDGSELQLSEGKQQ